MYKSQVHRVNKIDDSNLLVIFNYPVFISCFVLFQMTGQSTSECGSQRIRCDLGQPNSVDRGDSGGPAELWALCEGPHED